MSVTGEHPKRKGSYHNNHPDKPCAEGIFFETTKWFKFGNDEASIGTYKSAPIYWLI